MNYVAYSLDLISKTIKGNTSGTPTVIRVETDSGDGEPRRFLIDFIGEDYLVVRGVHKKEPEVLGFAHVGSWSFAKYNPDDWK